MALPLYACDVCDRLCPCAGVVIRVAGIDTSPCCRCRQSAPGVPGDWCDDCLDVGADQGALNVDQCDGCGQMFEARELASVQERPMTRWSPAEYGTYCEECRS